MDVSVGKRWESYIDSLVSEGRYGSAREAVEDGLRLIEEREAKLKALREMVNRSIEEGGEDTPEEVSAYLDEVAEELKAQGY